MCIQPRAGALIPETTVRVARACNPRGTVAMTIRDRLEGLWSDEDFAEWYPRDGRPGLSPAQLAIASVLQFLLELSDRQAAEAVRCRIDFKYAMGLELEDPGFHHSVLGDFRDRLAEDGRADKLFNLALERIKAVGLVKERGRARTDSTHAAPRGALSYPRFSREKLGGMFLGLMANLDPKGEGNHSMSGKYRLCSGV